MTGFASDLSDDNIMDMPGQQVADQRALLVLVVCYLQAGAWG